MMTDTMASAGLYAFLTTMAKPAREAVVPEPEFEPFKLSTGHGKAVRPGELAAANSPATSTGGADLAA